ncbi:MAG: hypothetical protein E6I52_19885 [Chloroflexi bacterium]|nr:MAG: hypothetical protein E6I52_19885 [Chloroflexota bacterium]
MVSALQTSLRSPSVLGRVADIFGDRNLYRVVVSSSEKQRARMRSASGELAQIAELEDRQLIVAIANQLAVAVDRQGRAEREARARAVDESDRLKSALVSSVSHELTTPLTAIKMSVTGLFWMTSSTITRTSAANWRSRSILGRR